MKNEEYIVQELIDNEEFSKLSYEYEMEEFPKKSRRKAQRRHNNIKKAIRKRNISERFYDGWIVNYNNLHQYSKNKIHNSRSPYTVAGENAQSCKLMEKMKYAEKEYSLTA